MVPLRMRQALQQEELGVKELTDLVVVLAQRTFDHNLLRTRAALQFRVWREHATIKSKVLCAPQNKY